MKTIWWEYFWTFHPVLHWSYTQSVTHCDAVTNFLTCSYLGESVQTLWAQCLHKHQTNKLDVFFKCTLVVTISLTLFLQTNKGALLLLRLLAVSYCERLPSCFVVCMCPHSPEYHLTCLVFCWSPLYTNKKHENDTSTVTYDTWTIYLLHWLFLVWLFSTAPFKIVT